MMSLVKKIIKKVSVKHIAGIFCFIGCFFFNKYIRNIDVDGQIAQHHEYTINFFIFGLIVLGLGLIFIDIRFSVKKLYIKSNFFIRIILYCFYLFIIFEILSFFVLKIIVSDPKIGDPLKFALGTLDKQSSYVSWMVPDMRSDYKPNIYSTRHNVHGFRNGGGEKNINSIRILCVGGSTTWGYEDDTSNTYPSQLEKYLRSKNYEVDVINAGVPYQTSLDVLMRFITKGIYTDPDIILIHTGGNDIGPLRSPYKYISDYTHWRDYGLFGYDKIFKNLWEKIPLSSFRLSLLFILKPGSGTKISEQKSYLSQEMLSKNFLKRKRTKGLENYFKSIISISKANGIIPITILFNSSNERENSWAKRKFKGENLKTAIDTEQSSIRLHNAIMDSISQANQTFIIPFDKFEPLEKTSWTDQAHLDTKGKKEKAEFIGDYIISSGLLDFTNHKIIE